ARSLERHLSKKRILELYLNVVEMGDRVYGAEAASRAYFNESASALSPAQAALLAGCLPNPRVMNPSDPNRRLRARQNMILSRMRRWGYLVEEETLAPPAPEPAPEPLPAPTDTTITTTDGTETDTTGTPPPSQTDTNHT